MIPVAIHAFNPGAYTGAGNWTWLIRGHVATLIDAGTGEPQHLDAVDEALQGATLAQVLVTHAHVDHASGAPALAERHPEARFFKMPWPDRDAKWSVRWEPIAPGERIVAGDTSVVAVHTPGHAPDHLCFWHAETRALFGGDLAIGGSTVFIPASHRGDLSDYLTSLDRVLSLNPERIFPAHGPVIEDPGKLLRGYIEHRHEREAQVIEALRHGDTHPAAMVTRIYKTLQDSLVPLAREGILAHLVKLEREGRARREGDSWHLAT